MQMPEKLCYLLTVNADTQTSKHTQTHTHFSDLTPAFAYKWLVARWSFGAKTNIATTYIYIAFGHTRDPCEGGERIELACPTTVSEIECRGRSGVGTGVCEFADCVASVVRKSATVQTKICLAPVFSPRSLKSRKSRAKSHLIDEQQNERCFFLCGVEFQPNNLWIF